MLLSGRPTAAPPGVEVVGGELAGSAVAKTAIWWQVRELDGVGRRVTAQHQEVAAASNLYQGV